MTAGTPIPQQPPPPSGPAGPLATSSGFDFAKPFTFVFEDPRWVNKVLVGGLFFLLAFFIIGWFFLMGYAARLARNVIAGVTYPLPEWDDMGNYFSEGVRLTVVALAYVMPIVVVVMLFVIPGAIMSEADSEALRNVGGCLAGGMWCLVFPLSLALTLFVPAALLMTAVENRMGAGFEFARIWRFIRANIGNYLLAVVVYLVARFAAGFGFFLLCIGIIFTEFWALCATAYGFAQVYRLSQKR